MYLPEVRALYAFERFVVSEIKMNPFIAEAKLRRDRRRALWCGGCGGRLTPSREARQFARDLALGPLAMTLIRYPAVQGHCRSWRGSAVAESSTVSGSRGSIAKDQQ